eukprot:CAMPEP_0183330566 /NCGR_PEP_ID=MMETSP0160_2-20130417/85368_1 /TAXON_ID=2839 ORGANISM="Odontella Sinensis, Strain Grunow 1884" /NCGR_SAMPLE_ID=MMETSP0160_2 /ASSEMBLY_ACC=CAM_ASM_000250 /LENGTH=173 /DNA_ID=CAMNT_0025498775 /DNA_START=325 /DNA_END=846 /DNA_ORIENTATION=+
MIEKGQVAQPTPAKRRLPESFEPGRIHDPNPKSSVNGEMTRDLFSDMKADVVSQIRSAFKQNKNVKDVTKRCRNHWKLHTEMPDGEFKKLWKKVKTAVEKVIEADQSASNQSHKTPGNSAKTPHSVTETPTLSHEEKTNGKMDQHGWAGLWMPEFQQSKEFQFDKWDELKLFS